MTETAVMGTGRMFAFVNDDGHAQPDSALCSRHFTNKRCDAVMERIGDREGPAFSFEDCSTNTELRCQIEDCDAPADAAKPLISGRERAVEESDFLACVIITAVEGGIGYWSQASNYRWWSTSMNDGLAIHVDGHDNAYVTVHPMDEDEQRYDPKGVLVTTDDIEDALQRIFDDSENKLSLHESYKQRFREAWDEKDAGQIDSLDADIIVQVAVLGEVTYG